MPQMANIVVKAANGTTDVTFTGIQPSAGDKVPAVWRDNAASTVPNNRPTLAVSGQYNGPRTARRMKGQVKIPVLKTVNGQEVSEDAFVFEFNGVVLQKVADSVTQEAVHRACNLFASALFKQQLIEGFAAS